MQRIVEIDFRPNLAVDNYRHHIPYEFDDASAPDLSFPLGGDNDRLTSALRWYPSIPEGGLYDLHHLVPVGHVRRLLMVCRRQPQLEVFVPHPRRPPRPVGLQLTY